MLKIIGIIVVVVIAALLIFAATKPDTFSVRRTASIKASADQIFPLINDLNRWIAWSPWEKKDPAMKRTLGTVTSGKGAAYAWDGNKEVGAGHMEITESSPSSKVVVKLDFIKPFEGHNVAEFALQPDTTGTSVTWTMYGPSPYVAKVMGLFFSMDSMIGKDFEEGLANLKALAEKHASST